MTNLAVIQKDITDSVNNKLNALKQEGLVIAPSYSPSNALKSAFFALTSGPNGNLLEKSAPDSVANALLNMVVQGLNPSKNQCYFIPYGNKVNLMRSYFGTQKVIKSLPEVEDIWANVIYEGDEFDMGIVNGREKLLKHETKFTNRDNPIIGAYAIIKTNDGEEILTVMTKKEIDKAWSKAKTSNVQKDFPQEMAKRTVINRAAKAYINTSDDTGLLTQAYNETLSNEYENETDRKIKDVTQEVESETATVVLDIPKIEHTVVIEPEVEETKVTADVNIVTLEAQPQTDAVTLLNAEGPGF